MKYFQILVGLLCFTLIFSRKLMCKKLVTKDESNDLPATNNKNLTKPQDHHEMHDMCKDNGSSCMESRRKNYTLTDHDHVQNKLRTHSPSRLKNICGLVNVKRSFTKVVGGKNSVVGAWPWLAALAYDLVINIGYLCSGSLVTRRHVITAAHCNHFNLIYVRLGEFDMSTDKDTKHLDVKFQKVLQLNLDESTGQNDLAIIILKKKVHFTDNIAPICLPEPADYRKVSYVGNQPFVAGWGFTKENGTNAKILQELQIQVLDNKQCAANYKEQGLLTSMGQFDDSIICAGNFAGGKDTCQGDSGGPLMMPQTVNGTLRYTLIGVTARGHGCARKKLAGSYTNVLYHLKWIMSNLK